MEHRMTCQKCWSTYRMPGRAFRLRISHCFSGSLCGSNATWSVLCAAPAWGYILANNWWKTWAVASGSKVQVYSAKAAASVLRWTLCPLLLLMAQNRLLIPNYQTQLRCKSPPLLNHRASNLNDLI